MEIEIKETKFFIPDELKIAPMEIPELETVIYNCLTAINDTDSIRIVVIETWLLTEFFIRLALSSAYDIKKYKCDKIDPKYDLLPNSFNACLEMLEKLLNAQRELPIMDLKKSFTAPLALLVC